MPHSRRHVPQETMPPPALLNLAVPLTVEDVRSGVVGHLLETLSSFPGLRDLTPDRLQACLAAGMGYESWDHMLALRGVNAKPFQMPMTEFHVALIMGWRMFVGGFATLSNAVVAANGALSASQLNVRKTYGLFGTRQAQDDDLESVSSRHIEVPGQKIRQRLSGPELLPNGRLHIEYRERYAFEAASYCWTPASGIDLDSLASQIAGGGELDIADAIDESWFADCWPVGLRPIQYMDGAGKLFGYGWAWPEIGCVMAKVFPSPQAFKQSAIALWTNGSTTEVAAAVLPATLTMVEFANPWDIRDFDTSMDRSIQHAIKAEGFDLEGPWLDVVPTNNGKIDYGVTLELSGELWTRHQRALSSDLNGMLGLVLPSMEDVAAKDQLIDWLHEKVPFAMEQATYEGVCQLLCAVSELTSTETASFGDPLESKRVSEMLLQSALVAQPVIAQVSELQMTGNLGMVAAFDVPKAGEHLRLVYPELDAITVNTKGEYALAFYGKNGIRHDAAHTDRDPVFMRYCVLRNLGLDPSDGRFDSDWIGVFHLLKRYIDSHPDVWVNSESRGLLATQAQVLITNIATANQWLGELDASFSESRLQMLGLANASE